jgi:hypothetical protein
MVTTQECIDAIKEAIKLYVAYTYEDNCVEEVIEMDSFYERFQEMLLGDTKRALDELKEYEYGNRFIDAVLNHFENDQSITDEEFETLAELHNY